MSRPGAHRRANGFKKHMTCHVTNAVIHDLCKQQLILERSVLRERCQLNEMRNRNASDIAECCEQLLGSACGEGWGTVLLQRGSRSVSHAWRVSVQKNMYRGWAANDVTETRNLPRRFFPRTPLRQGGWAAVTHDETTT